MYRSVAIVLAMDPDLSELNMISEENIRFLYDILMRMSVNTLGDRTMENAR